MESYKPLEDHSRTIIHIDIDCFYAQVEMIKDPKLKYVPLGIQQKNIVVTSNYIAREFGIKKCMLITEAREICPNLILVKGEDLHEYRQMSYKVTELLQKYSPSVNRLGLDENFLDVTNLVNDQIRKDSRDSIVGNVFGDISSPCECGCYERIKSATNIAQHIRSAIKTELGLTTSAGIAHNKLLAKIAGGQHKPDQQTVVFPNSAVEMMLSLTSLSRIPGIGYTTLDQLSNIGIRTVEDLQNCDVAKLEDLIGHKKAAVLHHLSFGIDPSSVKRTGKPQSIGIEDSYKSISADKEVREKMEQLLKRLLILVSEDGRTPRTIKLTVRKFDKSKKSSNRETRQCNLNTSTFLGNDIMKLSNDDFNKIMTVIMRLFGKAVDTSKPYHLTLLGLSFTKFIERPATKNTLTNFLSKNIEVQSVTDIESLCNVQKDPKEIPSTSATEIPEIEPLSKKSKMSNMIQKPIESSSLLTVSDLRLNSTDEPMDIYTNPNISCPPDADKDVFWALPKELQIELWENYKRTREREKKINMPGKRVKPNSIINYLVRQ
ncbi:unnamed protein product [Phaedon cochleariae]|uniref:UmuC domain-containing protein n=1 Tax=Phaedon cochleariae TaxID=80249 RepID=A0A9N9SC58_PHACE|nr:unnamed protein product [Phaedon cochleariae]